MHQLAAIGVGIGAHAPGAFGRGDPLHGVTLERIVTELVARHGWDELGRRIEHGQNQTWEQVEFRNLRQNALRALIPMTPDWMTA